MAFQDAIQTSPVIIDLVFLVQSFYQKGVHHFVFQIGRIISQYLIQSSYHLSLPESPSTPGFIDMLMSPIAFATFLYFTILCFCVPSLYFKVSQWDFRARYPKLQIQQQSIHFATRTIRNTSNIKASFLGSFVALVICRISTYYKISFYFFFIRRGLIVQKGLQFSSEARGPKAFFNYKRFNYKRFNYKRS